MPEAPRARAAIVDYGMGNLFSIKHACRSAGLEAFITSSRQDLLSATAVILPGVGAFGDAMEALRRLDLTGVLRDVAQSGRPLMGICLGLQLLMSKSHEFGEHDGLNIIEGDVTRFESVTVGDRRLKVPQVGWNGLSMAGGQPWEGSLLDGQPDGACMYFIHSFYVTPRDPGVVLSTTRYGPREFCSTLQVGNIFACQYHPERSGRQGLRVYHNLAELAARTLMETPHV